MKRIITLLTMFMLCFSPALIADAHSGRTDSNGGHNCSDKSIAKGLCTGYHYHNGGSATKSTTTKSSSTKNITPVKKIVPKPALTTVNVYIDDVLQNYNPKAYLKNGTTLVPMKNIFESLGATVTYDAATKKVTAYKNKTTIIITIGNKKAYIQSNGTTSAIDLNHAAEVYEGTTMVPLRFIGQALGAGITFDEPALKVFIHS
ncbi:copper amine oxidase N-terminal domain-containing protein [Solibacillus sp. FSL R7-0682]|uniref:copper amine oxidase N-terminal domain-containing protein n=1 Tax=Solibacillus sp. FSL R7-0682 TaxID=2921690 RepID=UPI0030FC1575